jgi:hypothetical protein
MKTPAAAPPSSPPAMLSTQSAIYILNSKIQAVEESHKAHMQAVEAKFGEQDTYVTDNIPDMDLVNKAISTINSRLLDLEGLEARVAALETAGGVPAKPAPKKRGTVKLDLDPEPGISFSN